MRLCVEAEEAAAAEGRKEVHMLALLWDITLISLTLIS